MSNGRWRWWLVPICALFATIVGIVIWRWPTEVYEAQLVDLAGNPVVGEIVTSSIDEVTSDQDGFVSIKLDQSDQQLVIGSGADAFTLALNEDVDVRPPELAELDAIFGDMNDSSLTPEERTELENEITQGYYPGSSEVEQPPVITVPNVDVVLPDLPPPVVSTDIVVNEEGMEVVQGEILVGWDATLSAEERTAAIAAAGGTIRYDDPETFTTIVYVADQAKVPQVVSQLKQTNGVTGVLQNYLLEEDDNSFAPSDPDYADKNKSWWLRKINMEPAWQMTKGSPSVVVAVIDAGFETDHPDLVGAFTRTTLNFSTTPLNANPRHGTHVSGIIAARQNNGEGLTGIAPKVRILPIKIDDLARLPRVFTTLKQWPGVRIASMSMGWGWRKKNNKRIQAGKPAFTQAYMQQQSAALDAIIRPAFLQYYQGGGIFCKSAGNDYGYDSQLNGLNFNEVITVGAGDSTGAVTNFSNVGSQVDITGPGYKMWSPVAGHTYDYLSGTSMATPAVCATAALVRSLRSSYSPLVVKLILEKGATEPNTYLDAWRSLLRATRRFGVTGSVVDEDFNFITNATVTTQPGMWNVTSTAEGNYVIPYLTRSNRTLEARKGEAKGKTSIIPPALSGDEVIEMVLIELEGKDDSNENDNSNDNDNGNDNSNGNENDNENTNANTNASGTDGTDSTDSVGGETVLDNGVVVSAEGCAVSGFNVPPGEGDCGSGFYFSRETIACEQIECPSGVGRTYTLECKCEGAGYKAIYACDTPGYMVACIQQ